MAITVISQGKLCRLIFSGRLTYEFAGEMEDSILDSLRRHSRFEVDLSAVTAVDLCGIHLLGVLDTLAGKALEVVAPSEVVNQSRKNLLSSSRRLWRKGGDIARPDGL